MAAEGWPKSCTDLYPVMLQWGRGRMAAEGFNRLELVGNHGAASMGPRPNGRGRRLSGRSPLTACTASMGPRPDGRGRRYGRRGGGGQLPRVNGAAAGWPRKVEVCINPSPRRNSVNGAAAGWPRKGLACRPRRSGARASMGPRPDGRGRRPDRPAVRGRARRVNGAAAGWPRKVLPIAEALRPGWRQWGRGRMAAEGAGQGDLGAGVPRVNGAAAGWPRKGLIGRRRLAVFRASMGPRPDGRGRGAARIHGVYEYTASMGPRPDGRGRTSSVNFNSSAAAASMGPRPDGRGRSGTTGGQTATLQRQWGRGRMAAEGGTIARMNYIPPVASMGPRPDGRGRQLRRQLFPHCLCQRQWGRGRMAAEGLATMYDLAGGAGRQWGRGRMAAEGRGGARPSSCL